MNLLKETKKFCRKNGWKAQCRIVEDEIRVIFIDLPSTITGNTEKSAERFKKLFGHLSEIRKGLIKAPLIIYLYLCILF